MHNPTNKVTNIFTSFTIKRADAIFSSNNIREFLKLHVYRKGQTSDSSWEFLKIENKQIKIAQKILMGKNLRENTNLCLEIMNSRRQAKETLVTWYKFWRTREENAEKNYGETSIK